MLKIYDLGTASISSGMVIKIYVDKLYELGLGKEYVSSEFTHTSSMSYGDYQITFKDGVKSILHFGAPNASNTSYPEYTNNLGRALFVDEDNHFILCATTMSSFLNTKTSETITYYMQAMCCDDWYGNNASLEGRNNSASSNHFNTPSMALGDVLGDKFTLYPLYMAYEGALPKNLYFSPDKFYPVGTTIIDTAGNKFASVTPRFFYLME